MQLLSPTSTHQQAHARRQSDRDRHRKESHTDTERNGNGLGFGFRERKRERSQLLLTPHTLSHPLPACVALRHDSSPGRAEYTRRPCPVDGKPAQRRTMSISPRAHYATTSNATPQHTPSIVPPLRPCQPRSLPAAPHGPAKKRARCLACLGNHDAGFTTVLCCLFSQKQRVPRTAAAPAVKCLLSCA